MTKPNNFPREKDRALPWSKGLPIFNTATGKYEARPKSRPEKSAVVARGIGLGPRPVSSNRPGDKKRKLDGGVSFVPPKKRRFVRQKNGGLPDDFPTVLFPGEAMAIAVKKTEELKKEFPGMSLVVALEKKKAAEGEKTKKTKEEGGRAAQVPRRTRVPAGEEKGRKRKVEEEDVVPSGVKRRRSREEDEGEKKEAPRPKRPKFDMDEFFGRKGR